jgi:hypothetical protein
MARQRGTNKLQGTVGGLTYVISKKYGQLVRNPRGTHKKAKLNPVLMGNTESIKRVTALGSSMLKDLKTVDRNFVSGRFWSEMMRRMMKAKDNSIHGQFDSIKGMELNERYPFSGYFSSSPVLSFSFNKSKLSLVMEIVVEPDYPEGVNADQYLLEVVVLFLDGRGNCVSERMETEWLSGEESLGVYEMEFVTPKTAKYFLIVHGIKAGKDNKAVESFTARGYKIWGWGKC